jgi:CoA:oxalate CoA-transferase
MTAVAPAARPAAASAAAELIGGRAPEVERSVSWHGPGDTSPGSEDTAQALACLMALHGDAGGEPRRLRLAVASVGAGVLAAQGALAAAVARSRGGQATSVETSALAAALLLASHHIAVAGAGRDGPASGRPRGGLPVGRHPTAPPFRSADGAWFELEAIGFEPWVSLWEALGVAREDAADAWASFAPRYVTGSCVLPASLHEAAARLPFADVEARAAERGLAAVSVRDEGRAGVPPWRLDAGSAMLAAAAGAAPPPQRPLAGLRVVELTSRLQGPLAGRLLHWLGADVLKVEPPGGDPGRFAPGGPFRAAYLAYNHGKRFTELDYRTPAGRSELAALVAGADVFLHNARPGRAERYGFDADRLERARPGLVHVQLAGWDAGSGRGDAVAGDYVVQADSGVAAALTEPGEPPRPSPLTLLDVLGGMLGCTAALAGLLDRERHGVATRATTTLAGAAALLLRHGAAPRGGPERPLPTASGWLAIAPDAVEPATPLSRPAAEWERELAGVPCAAVRTDPAALPADPRTRALLAPVADGVFAAGPPWRFAA